MRSFRFLHYFLKKIVVFHRTLSLIIVSNLIHMRKLVLLVSALLCAVFIGNAQQQVPELPIDPAVRYGKLDNGLTYYIRHNEEPKGLVNFYIAQKVGSVQEDDSQRGLAHFLEHMCFNGSVNFPGDGQLIKYCESIGVKFGENLNAYTSTDETVYNIDDIPVTESNIDSCLLILHDWADGLLLEESEIEKERGVIHEEWRMRSSATQRILERRLPEIYPGSKYGYRMPIGLMEVVDNFPPEVLRAYYEKWYRPDLQGIVIVGDIDVDSIESKIKDIFGPIQMPENPAPYEFYPVPDNEEGIYVVDKDPELQSVMIELFFKSEPMPLEMNNTVLRLVNDYMTYVVSSCMNARFNELSQKPDCPFVVAQFGYGTFLLSKTMDSFELGVLPKPGQNEAAIQAAVTELERARRFGFNETEVIRAREEFMSSIERIYDNRNKQRNSFYVDQYVRHFLDNIAIPDIDTEYNVYKMYAPQLPAATFNEIIKQVTEDYSKNMIVLALFPEKEGVAVPEVEQVKAAVEAGKNAELEAYVDNVKDEPLIAKLPKPGKIKKETPADFGYTKWTLANGANVYFKQTDFNDSEILMSARSKGGYSLIAQEDLLNAQILPDVINSSGLGNFNSVELQKALAGKQVSLSVGLAQTIETVSGQSTPKDLRTLFELIYLGFTSERDDQAAFDNIMSIYRVQLENAEKVPTKALNDSIQTTVYNNHPRVKNLELADLDNISYDRIKAIYKDRFSTAGEFDFFFTGSFDKDTLKAFVEQYIAPLQKAKKRETFVDWNVYPREGVVENRFTRSMETPQAYIVQLWSGVLPFSQKNLQVVNAVGSILDQRYLKSIREDGGMAYSVSAQGSTSFGSREDYMIQVICPFTPALCDEVLGLMEKGVKDIAADGVTEEELGKVRSFVAKQREDNFRKNSYWQNAITSKVLWGYDTHTGAVETVQSITSDDLKDFVNNVLLKQNNRTTIVMLPEDLTE